MAPRKRASSDHIREQAKRNVRPAKGKSVAKGRQESSQSSSKGLSPNLPTMISDGSDGNSEFGQQGSSTDVDEEFLEEEEGMAGDYRRKGHDKKKASKDARTMAQVASNSSAITVVSRLPEPEMRKITNNLKRGPRPPNRTLKPSRSLSSAGGSKPRHLPKHFPSSPSLMERASASGSKPRNSPKHFPSSPSLMERASAGGSKPWNSPKHFPSSPSLTERDITDTEDNSTGNTDITEVQGIFGKEQALLKNAEELIYMLTLFVNPFPTVVTLNTWLVEVWEEAEVILGDAEQSARARVLVSSRKPFLEEN